MRQVVSHIKINCSMSKSQSLLKRSNFCVHSTVGRIHEHIAYFMQHTHKKRPHFNRIIVLFLIRILNSTNKSNKIKWHVIMHLDKLRLPWLNLTRTFDLRKIYNKVVQFFCIYLVIFFFCYSWIGLCCIAWHVLFPL